MYTVVDNDTLANVIIKIANLVNGIPNGKPDLYVVALANPAISATFTEPYIWPAGQQCYVFGGGCCRIHEVALPRRRPRRRSSNRLTGGAELRLHRTGSFGYFGWANSCSEGAAVSGVPNAQGFYPTKLGGVQVYFRRAALAPLLYVSSTQINCQLPFEVSDANGVTRVLIRTECRRAAKPPLP